MSIAEIKHVLRKSDFPFCVREALNRIEQLFSTQNVNKVPNPKQMDLAMEIMAEFIFCEVDRRGGKKKLTSVQELQLLEVLCDYFSFPGCGSDAARNTIFMSLFPPNKRDRSPFLVKLVSMAISTKNVSVLIATGTWIQQLGSTSKFVLDLADGLVKDYFVLVPNALNRLQDLPQIASHFTANFLTVVAQMYEPIDKRQVFIPPPNALLEVLTQWISENNQLCVAALMVDLRPVLPIGAIPMAAITPYTGLLRWCVLMPLYAVERNTEEPEAYTNLHLSLIESLCECGFSPATHQCLLSRDIVSAQHLSAIAEPISRWYAEISGRELENIECQKYSNAVCKSVDRLSQLVQVALAMDCVYGNKQDLFNQLETLPDTPLLRKVLNTQKKL